MSRCAVHNIPLSRIHGCTLCGRGSVRADASDAAPLQLEPSDEVSELRIQIARVLERWQMERADLDPDAEHQRAKWALLSEHIEQLKQAITSKLRANGRAGQPPLVVVDETERDVLSAALLHYRNALATAPRAGEALVLSSLVQEHQRIAWQLLERNEDYRDEQTPTDVDPFVAEVQRVARLVSNPPGGDRIGATLNWIGLQHALQMQGGGGGRVGGVRVRQLTEEERTAMKEYLEFVQREPLPLSDAEARQRLFEARVKWPQIAKLFEGGAGEPTCTLCSYPQDKCRCVEYGWR